ncbi:MAG: AMP-binding protein [Marinomonas sp.]
MASQFHLADLFETVAAAVPDRIAIQSDAGDLTYAMLDERTDRLAAALSDRGIGAGDSIGLYLMNGPEYLEGFIAASKLGAVPFNVNYRYGAEELRYLFTNAEAAVIIHNGEFAPLIEEIRPSLESLKLSVAVGETDENSASEDYETLMKAPPVKGFARHEDDYMLQYTGGTTGMPKGVMWPHKAFFFACLGAGGHFHPAGPITKPDEIAGRAAEGYQLKMFTIAPLMHGAAIWAAWSGLLGGLTLVLDPMRSFDAEAIWDRVAKYKVNIVQIVGDAMARPLCDALDAHPERWDLASVVNFGSGGAVFSKHLKEAIKAHLPNTGITDGMGTSEGGISGMAEPSEDGMMRLPANDDQKVMMDDRFAEVGETGLLARAGNVPIGYFNDPVKTAEVFREMDGRIWTLSGDQGRLDDDGMITLFGRGSTCINTGGEKVFPEEVESELRAHPAVHDAVVVGLPDERWGEAVTALVSLSKGADETDTGDIRAFLKTRLAGYKCPKQVFAVPDIRRSPAGKQDYAWARDVAEAKAKEDIFA